MTQRMAALGLDVDKLAEALGRHPDEVRSWTTIRGTLPGSIRRPVEWVLALEQRNRLMRASGLPACAWMEANSALRIPARDRAALRHHMAALEAHVAGCEICQRRQAYVATLPSLPTPPMAAHVRLLLWLVENVRRLPPWARPAAVGALALGALTAVRAILVVLAQPSALAPGLLAVPAAVGIGAYGGLVGGLAYTVARGATARRGRLGDYLTGLACAWACVIAFGVPLAILTRDAVFRSPSGWLVLLLVATVAGLLVGHLWFKKPAGPGDA